MKLPEDRICPNGWPNCIECKHDRSCKPGHYHIEEDIDVVIKAAEVCEKVVQAEAVESVAKIRGSWAERFLAMTEEERWVEHGRYKTPNLQSVEPWQALSGPSSPGGGGTCRVPKKPKKKMPEYLKTFGQ